MSLSSQSNSEHKKHALLTMPSEVRCCLLLSRTFTLSQSRTSVLTVRTVALVTSRHSMLKGDRAKFWLTAIVSFLSKLSRGSCDTCTSTMAGSRLTVSWISYHITRFMCYKCAPRGKSQRNTGKSSLVGLQPPTSVQWPYTYNHSKVSLQ